MRLSGYYPTILSLLAANLVTIAFAITQGWSLLLMLWIYWFQSVIIGAFNFFRILDLKEFSTKNFYINQKPVEPTEQTKLFTAFFFAFHYGFFHLTYLIFLIVTPAFSNLNTLFEQGIPTALPLINIPLIPVLVAVFFFNHLYSYIYYKNKPKKKQNIGNIMFYPYARIVPMHVIIASGGLLLGAESSTVLLFLLMKTGADVIMHYIEHKEQWV